MDGISVLCLSDSQINSKKEGKKRHYIVRHYQAHGYGGELNPVMLGILGQSWGSGMQFLQLSPPRGEECFCTDQDIQAVIHRVLVPDPSLHGKKARGEGTVCVSCHIVDMALSRVFECLFAYLLCMRCYEHK